MMKYTIEMYINRIDDWDNSDGTKEYIIRGDGVGDFEKLGSGIPELSILYDYLDYLEEQRNKVNDLIATYYE